MLCVHHEKTKSFNLHPQSLYSESNTGKKIVSYAANHTFKVFV